MSAKSNFYVGDLIVWNLTAIKVIKLFEVWIRQF